MLKKQKNELLEKIMELDIGPENFKSYESQVEGFPSFIIELLNSPLKFEIVRNADSYKEFDFRFTRFGPDFPLEDFILEQDLWAHFSDVLEAFDMWLVEDVKEYIDEQTLPDLWAQLDQQREFIPSATMGKDDTLPYSEEDKTQIRLSINEFRLQIINNFKPNDDQMKVIGDRLNYLSEALDRLSRFDWKAVAIASIISISTALSLDTEKGKLLFNLFKQIFSKVVYLLN